MRLLLAASVAACASHAALPSNPADLVGEWANVPPIHLEAFPPFGQDMGSSTLTITFGSDGTFEQTSSGSATAIGTYAADDYTIEFTTSGARRPTPPRVMR